MARNLKQLQYASVFAMVAALVGCGGGSDDPGTKVVNPYTGGSAGSKQDGDVCAMSLGGPCADEGAIDPCTNFVCLCGEWQDPSNPKDCADAGVDAEPDAEPDVDAGEDADQPDAEPDAEPDSGHPDVVTPEEICGNGADDDGNGKADCQDSACAGELECQEEICDGQDNNGNSQVDEGFECVQGTPAASCQTSCGSFGTMQCGNDCTWDDTCVPPSENCTNGVDDDCDGDADCEDPSCSSEPMCQCESPTMGTSCNSGPDTYLPGQYHKCDPNFRCDCNFVWADPAGNNFACANTELCNGMDDNGSGQADDGPGMECVKNSSEVCTTSCGTIGSKTCSNTCTWSACNAPVEQCFNGTDDDCDGDADCDDSDCAALAACQDEVCDGADNNGNGQIDESFDCVQNSTNPCTTSCGSQGTSQCSASCTTGACIAFEDCYSGGDEDCDGKANCDDSDCSGLPQCQVVDCTDPLNCSEPECQSSVACHDFGTCAQQSPTGSGYECGVYTQDSVPSSIFQIKHGCANSEYNQWAIGGTWSDVKAVHLTGNHTWNEKSLPVAGKVNKGGENVLCLNENRSFLMYNDYNGGIVLSWNGVSFTRIMESTLSGYNAMALWGTSDSDLWIAARNDDNVDDVRVFHWNGSSTTSTVVNPFAPNSWLPLAMWGTASDDIYVVGYSFNMDDIPNNAYWQGVVMHWDGKSWAQIQTPSSLKYLGAVHGSSSCDVMATGMSEGGAEGVGATVQRNGSTWDLATYDNVNSIASLHKAAPFRFMLQAYEEIGAIGRVWMGTPNASAQIDWSSIDEDFYYPGATWAVPGTSPQVIMTAGDGNNGPEIRRTTCQ